MPKGDRDFTPEERDALRRPLRWRRERLRQLKRVEKSLLAPCDLPAGEQDQRRARAVVPRLHRRGCSPTAPTSREAVTPTYPYWGKRMILASTYYPALKRDNVELDPAGGRGGDRDR